MPDNFIPADVLRGQNSAVNAAMKLDTLERMNKVFGQSQDPMAFPIEDIEDKPSYSQSDLMNPETSKLKLAESIYSTDPQIRNKAMASIEAMAYDTPAAQGLGGKNFVPYEREHEKYLKGDFGYNPYVSMQENEDFNYRYDYMDHTFAGRTLRNLGTGLTRFLGSVAAKTVQTFGYLGSMIGNGIEEIFDPKNNNAMADIADNSLSRWAEHWEEDMKSSNLLSVFKPRGWEDMGFFQKLGHGTFWTDEVADGAAFMGEMILSTYLTAGLGRLAGLAKFGATPINMASKLGKVGKGADFFLKTFTGADDISGIGRWAFLTASESAFEAAHLYKDVKDNLIHDRRKGLHNLTDDEIEKEAGSRASAAFKGNMLVLSVSNAFENRMLFNKMFGKAKGANPLARNITLSKSTENLDELAKAERRTFNYKTKVGKALNWKDSNSRLRFYGKRALSATAMEGYWEENAQLAIERLAAGDNLTLSSFTSQLAKQTKNATTGDDVQASESIGLGAIIGVGGINTMSKISGERRGIEKATLETINIINKYRKEFLNFQDIYVTDENGKVKLDEDGNMEIDYEKAQAVVDGISKFTNKQAALDNIKDPLLRKHMQDEALAEYIYAVKKVGIFDGVVDRFNNLGSIDPKQLMELGFDPNTTVDTVAVNRAIKDLGEIYDKVEEEEVVYPAKEKAIDDNRKATLFKVSSRVYSSNKLANEYQEGFLSNPISSPFSDEVNAQTSDIHMFNSVKMQMIKLAQFANTTGENGEFYKEYIEKERARLGTELERLGQLVKNKINDRLVVVDPETGFLVAPAKTAFFNSNSDTAIGNTDEFSQFQREKEEAFQEKEKVRLSEDKKEDNPASPDERFNKVDVMEDQILQQQLKHAELVNSANQHQYLVDKLSNRNNGFQNFKDYLEYIENIHKKDNEADTKEEEEVKAEEEKAAAPVQTEAEKKEAEETDKEILTQLSNLYSRIKSEVENGEEVSKDEVDTFMTKYKSKPPLITDFLISKVKEQADPLLEKANNKTLVDEDLIELEKVLRVVNYFTSSLSEEELEDFNMYVDSLSPIMDYLDNKGEKEEGEEEEEEEEQQSPSHLMFMGKKAGFDIFFDRNLRKFVYFKKGKEVTRRGAKTASKKVTPTYFKNWYRELASQAQKDFLIGMEQQIRQLLHEASNYEYQDNLTTFIMRHIIGMKFTPSILKDLTDVSKNRWVSEQDGQPLDTFVSDYLLGEMEQYGFFGMDEQEVMEEIRMVIQQYPNGITKKDIKDAVRSGNPILELESLEDEYLDATGLDLIESINQFNDIKDEKQNGENNGDAEVSEVTSEDEEGEGDGAGETEPVPDSEWNDFVDKAVVTNERLTSIAKKILAREPLSQREAAIHADKASKIEEIIKMITTPQETDEERKARIAESIALSIAMPYSFHMTPSDQDFYNLNKEEIDALVEKRVAEFEAELNKAPKNPANSEEETQESNNALDKFVDEAKAKGKFTFVQMSGEVVPDGNPTVEKMFTNNPPKITDGAVVLASSTGKQTEQALRLHNVLRKYGNFDSPGEDFHSEENGEKKFKLKLIRGNEKLHGKWVFNHLNGIKDDKGRDYRFPFIIAVITNAKGEEYYFDLEGNIVTDKSKGQPVAISYSVTEYKPHNIGLTRKAAMTYGYDTMEHGFMNENPMADIADAVNKGVPLLADIEAVTVGQLSTSHSNNAHSNYSKIKYEMRTVKEMVEAGDILLSASPFVFSTGDRFINAVDEKGDQPQGVKKGQPYVFDSRSNMYIPLRGKKLKDLTYEGSSVMTDVLQAIVKGLQTDGKVKFEDASIDEVSDIYEFLRAMFYSQDIQFTLSKDGSTIYYKDHRPARIPLSETEVNFNFDTKNKQLPTSLKVPLEDKDFVYEDFVAENFLSGAIPAIVEVKPDGTKVRRFEKLNRRIIFTLEKSHKEILAAIAGTTPSKKPIVVSEDEFTQFVGKKYRTPKGTMDIMEFDTATNEYVYKNEKGETERMKRDIFNKVFSRMTEITTVKPSEEVKEEMENKITLSKDEVNEILAKAKNLTEEDIDNIQFDEC